jgi:hypothetical protein
MELGSLRKSFLVQALRVGVILAPAKLKRR